MGTLTTLIRKLRTRLKVKTTEKGEIIHKDGRPALVKIVPRLLGVFERKVHESRSPRRDPEAKREERSERRKLRRKLAARYATICQALACKESWPTIRERARFARKLGR